MAGYTLAMLLWLLGLAGPPGYEDYPATPERPAPLVRSIPVSACPVQPW